MSVGFRARQKHAYTVSRGLCHLWTYGAAMIYATNTIKRNNEAGMKVRAHIFFIAATDDGSSADEIAEVVLLAAQMEHEEKKTKYYGNLLANIAFSLLR